MFEGDFVRSSLHFALPNNSAELRNLVDQGLPGQIFHMKTGGFRDYFQLLGVERSANANQIKTAFRKLARKYHPDLNQGDSQAEAKFKEINEAY